MSSFLGLMSLILDTDIVPTLSRITRHREKGNHKGIQNEPELVVKSLGEVWRNQDHTVQQRIVALLAPLIRWQDVFYVLYPSTTQHNTTQHNTTQHNTTQHNNIWPTTLFKDAESSIMIPEKESALIVLITTANRRPANSRVSCLLDPMKPWGMTNNGEESAEVGSGVIVFTSHNLQLENKACKLEATFY